MHLDLELLLLAIFLGAVLQVGVGIGFSIVAGPPMMVLLGTTVAVPVLLMLNTLVSAIAVDWRIWVAEKKTIKTAIVGCLLGVALGVVIYPYLSEQIVLILTGILLLIGVLTTLLPLRSVAGTKGFAAISGLSGLATVWAATPGPLMVFGLIATGRSARDTRKLVQPIALVAYGVALLLHGLVDGVAFAQVSNVWAFAIATFFGSILGRVVGPLLPQHLIKNAIRIVSILACYALFRRAYLIS